MFLSQSTSTQPRLRVSWKAKLTQAWKRNSRRRGFTLVELLSSISIVLVLTAMTLPAIKGQAESTSLNTGSQIFSNLLLQARSEAIARNTVVRFAVVKDWEGKEEANLRRVALWLWNHETLSYEQLTPWEELPHGVALLSGEVDFIREARYASEDASSVRGHFVMNEDEVPQDDVEIFTNESGEITMSYLEFLPNGSVRFQKSESRHGIFVLTSGVHATDVQLSSSPSNWAQINVDALTGRARTYQP